MKPLDRCPNCASPFAPGVQARQCVECGKMLCVACRDLFEQRSMCLDCVLEKLESASRDTPLPRRLDQLEL